jgi:hypothetical protein
MTEGDLYLYSGWMTGKPILIERYTTQEAVKEAAQKLNDHARKNDESVEFFWQYRSGGFVNK